jgi:glycine/D-amino acid oxidase-like deaminating enzyme
MPDGGRRPTSIWWDDLPDGFELPAPAGPVEGLRVRTCVVGGGIAGASLAYSLARRGESVAVFERGMPGHGASGRNAGFLLADSECVDLAARLVGEEAALALRAAGLAARRAYRDVRAPFEPTGSVRLAEDAGEAGDFALTAARRLRGVRLADVDDVPERGGAGPYLSALIDDGDGATHSVRALMAFVRAAERLGATFHAETPVLRIVRAGRRVEIETSHGRATAERVVVATNSEARLLLGGDVAPIRPVRAQALAAVVDPPPPWKRPVYATRGGDYWRPLPGGRVLLGGLRRLAKPREATRSTRTSAGLQGALDRFLRRLVGDEASVRVTHRWAGTMGFTRDGLPRVGPAPGRPGVHLFAGWNGHGMGWAPGFAEALAEHLLGGGPPPARSLRPMSLGRRGARA